MADSDSIQTKKKTFIWVLKHGKYIHFAYLPLDAQTPPFRFQIDWTSEQILESCSLSLVFP